MTDELNRSNRVPDGPAEISADPVGRTEAAAPLGAQSSNIESAMVTTGGPASDVVAGAEAGSAPTEDQDGGDVEALSAEHAINLVEPNGAGSASSGEPQPVGLPADESSAAEAELTPSVSVPPAPSPSTAATARAKPAGSSRRKAAEEQPKEDKPKSAKMDWYILKVQSNREESIKEGLLRRVAIAGLEYFFGDVIVPTEKVTEFKAGKKRVRKRKLYPGYLVVQMEINDDTWFLVRETPGIGDFTGAAGRPAPMLPHEVSRILSKQEEKSEKAPKLNISFRPGDQVKINEGTFENFEGQVQSIDEQNGRVTVMINIFGRSTPVELEYWQIGSV